VGQRALRALRAAVGCDCAWLWSVAARRGGSVERCERQDATASRTEARRRPEIERTPAAGDSLSLSAAIPNPVALSGQCRYTACCVAVFFPCRIFQ
jgi:hypothetical protein